MVSLERAPEDLREFIEQARQLEQLESIEGADWDLELATIGELWGSDGPALLFDAVKDYPRGFRVLTNALRSPERIGVASGLGPIHDRTRLTLELRNRLATLRPEPHVLTATGPVLQNVRQGDDVNLWEFPVPRFHELDGGRFIGTGCLVVTKDPDTGWINVGTYRVMVHDGTSVGLGIASGKHGQMHLKKYWAAGQAAPVAICLGHDPLLFMCAGLEVPHNVCEYDYAGGLRGFPYQMVAAPYTGLPIPAGAELVIEGEVAPGDELPEGPFGEWAGYYVDYVGPRRIRPVARIRSVCYRNDPILFTAAPGRPPSDSTYFKSAFKSAAIWDEVERAGVPGIRGVWEHEAGGGRLFLVVSIEAMYPGHSKQAGFIAANCHQGAYANRFVIVVDDDIHPGNLEEVVWAMSTRVDLRHDIDIIDRCWTSPSDPMLHPQGEVHNMFNSRMIMDATRPWERRGAFPPVAEASLALKKATEAKWGHLLAKRQG